MNFPKATAVIDEQVNRAYDTAYNLKCDMQYVKDYLDEMISSPSLSIHNEDITSQEATETFDKILKCSHSTLDELTED